MENCELLLFYGIVVNIATNIEIELPEIIPNSLFFFLKEYYKDRKKNEPTALR